MREEIGNMFDRYADALVISVNGFVKSSGECVMGRGCALQAAKLDSTIPARLGDLLRRKGNNVHPLGTINGVLLFSFPVKPVDVIFDGTNAVGHMASKFRKGQRFPGWAAKADPLIIRQSALQLRKLADDNGFKEILIPRPGCGAGELDWEDIRPMLAEILDDRFIAMHNG